MPENTCTECRTRDARLERIRKQYHGKDWNALDLINLRFRQGLAISEIADIFDETEDFIRLEIEIVKQNAQ